MSKNKSKYQHYTIPCLFDLSESALVKVVPHSLVITAFSVLIVALWNYTNIKLGIKSDFILVITFVVSLLLAYRTNAAYTRYWEGRQLWSTMITSIRNLIRYVWANAPKMNQINENNEKEIDFVFRLLAEFAAATNEYLRKASSNDNNEDENNVTIFGKIRKCFQKSKQEQSQIAQPPKIKLIVMYLTQYISQLESRKNIEKPNNATISQMYANVEKLVECLTSLESVIQSPIPKSYIIHLLQTTWIFCLSLPFQLVEDLKWATVPVVFLSSLLLLGVEAIAREIEDPFGTDPNDLKIDDFCKTLDTEQDFVKNHKYMGDQWQKAIDEILNPPEITREQVTVDITVRNNSEFMK